MATPASSVAAGYDKEAVPFGRKFLLRVKADEIMERPRLCEASCAEQVGLGLAHADFPALSAPTLVSERNSRTSTHLIRFMRAKCLDLQLTRRQVSIMETWQDYLGSRLKPPHA